MGFKLKSKRKINASSGLAKIPRKVSKTSTVGDKIVPVPATTGSHDPPNESSTTKPIDVGKPARPLSALDSRAIEEIEKLARRQASTGCYVKPKSSVNKRYLINSLAAVERHNARTKSHIPTPSSSGNSTTIARSLASNSSTCPNSTKLTNEKCKN